MQPKPAAAPSPSPRPLPPSPWPGRSQFTKSEIQSHLGEHLASSLVAAGAGYGASHLVEPGPNRWTLGLAVALCTLPLIYRSGMVPKALRRANRERRNFATQVGRWFPPPAPASIQRPQGDLRAQLEQARARLVEITAQIDVALQKARQAAAAHHPALAQWHTAEGRDLQQNANRQRNQITALLELEGSMEETLEELMQGLESEKINAEDWRSMEPTLASDPDEEGVDPEPLDAPLAEQLEGTLDNVAQVLARVDKRLGSQSLLDQFESDRAAFGL